MARLRGQSRVRCTGTMMPNPGAWRCNTPPTRRMLTAVEHPGHGPVTACAFHINIDPLIFPGVPLTAKLLQPDTCERRCQVGIPAICPNLRLLSALRRCDTLPARRHQMGIPPTGSASLLNRSAFPALRPQLTGKFLTLDAPTFPNSRVTSRRLSSSQSPPRQYGT